jgi:AraC-like DNA-binding protein
MVRVGHKESQKQDTSVLQACQVQVRFRQPPAELRRYFTTFYFVELAAAPGATLVDQLHPEWANLRFHSGAFPSAVSVSGSQVSGTSFAATGPSSRAVAFTVGATRMWGIGLLPLGWAKFVGVAADSLADAVIDGHTHPAFARFASLAASIYDGAPDEEAEFARIAAWFMARANEPVADETRITAIHAALVDPEVSTVAELVDRAGVGQRTLERVCRKAFGFAPKLLLRRQRFMRSLAQYMLDPSHKWIGAIDGSYHDQAQFVRDFRQFMGMTPRQYAALDHPIIGAIMMERAHHAGAAVQTLDGPEGGGRLRT